MGGTSPGGETRVVGSSDTIPAMEGAAVAVGVEASAAAPRLLTEARALLEGGGGTERQQQHLYLPHAEAGYERVTPLAVDAVKGIQVQGVGMGADGSGDGAAGGVRWVGWPELTAVAEKRCVVWMERRGLGDHDDWTD